ncbi:DoxX family protein [Ureibacillus sp. NPDC094379]
MLKQNEFGTLFIRMILGAIFTIHGFEKFKEGIQETIGRFEGYEIPYAEYVAFGVAGVELIGGFFLIIGFSTRFIAALFAIIMIGAIVKVRFELGFINGYEFNLALLAMSLYLLFGGSKMMALDNFLGQSKKKRKYS